MDNKQIPGAIIIAGLIIGGAILLKGSNPPTAAVNPGTGATQGDVSKIRQVAKEEHILGNLNAEVMIVEYSDTECPFCKIFHSTLHQVVEENNGKVAWVYRHYPIPSLHKKATHEAIATECAWEQGGNQAFWSFTDEVYKRTNSNDSLAEAELPKIAQDLGLNVATFNTCLASEKFAEKVQADVNNGNTIGVRGTPFSVILKNGKVVGTIGGAQPIESVREQIKKALE